MGEVEKYNYVKKIIYVMTPYMFCQKIVVTVIILIIRRNGHFMIVLFFV
jgi:hypothetical protein